MAATAAASVFYGEKYGSLALAGYALIGLGVLFALKEGGGKNEDKKKQGKKAAGKINRARQFFRRP